VSIVLNVCDCGGRRLGVKRSKKKNLILCPGATVPLLDARVACPVQPASHRLTLVHLDPGVCPIARPPLSCPETVASQSKSPISLPKARPSPNTSLHRHPRSRRPSHLSTARKNCWLPVVPLPPCPRLCPPTPHTYIPPCARHRRWSRQHSAHSHSFTPRTAITTAPTHHTAHLHTGTDALYRSSSEQPLCPLSPRRPPHALVRLPEHPVAAQNGKRPRLRPAVHLQHEPHHRRPVRAGHHLHRLCEYCAAEGRLGLRLSANLV
jgi:hypothetical protein